MCYRNHPIVYPLHSYLTAHKLVTPRLVQGLSNANRKMDYQSSVWSALLCFIRRNGYLGDLGGVCASPYFPSCMFLSPFFTPLAPTPAPCGPPLTITYCNHVFFGSFTHQALGFMRTRRISFLSLFSECGCDAWHVQIFNKRSSGHLAIIYK